MEAQGDYRFPPFSLLDPGKPSEKIDKAELYEKKQRIEEKLRQFKVQGEVREYHPGPVITTYEFYPDPGIKISQVAGLSEDLSLALTAESVRIQRIPGKSSLGVEIPNNKREIINLRDIIQSEKFMNSPSKLSFALGKTVHGEVYVTDLTVMPHLLIAGATGTGKSVALNALIASILYKATPEEVKLILIDPKRLEFTLYEGIPHLLSPVINDPKKAGPVLLYAIKKMEDRYQTMNLAKVRNIEQYNQQIKQLLAEKKGKLSEEEKLKLKPFPYIVIIIDELAELMMVGKQDVDECITRLAQLARAVGIHLVMATQRPSVDVITGTIKNNFSSRIAFRVPSKIDARIILDTQGAEKLLGLGDMLFMPPNYPRIIRLHCAYISIPEVRRLVKFVREQGPPKYDEKIVNVIKAPSDQTWEEGGEKDELFDQAVRLILLTGQASVSYLQRKLKLGYARAARIIDQMEQEGILGPGEGSKPREILVDPKNYLKQIEKG
jgi:S-DNA-T family DNA segregation ATPase FtsK/SpoIIIE